MKDNNRKWKKSIFGAILITTMILSFMIGVSFMQNIKEDPRIFEKPVLEWFKAPMVLATNQTLGAGVAGIVNILTVNESDIPDYNSEIPQGSAYVYEHCDASFDDVDPDAPHEELSNTTPYDAGFCIVIPYQFTQAQAYDSGSWNSSRVKAYMNTTGMDTGGDATSQLMEKGTWYAGDDATTQRINFYLKDGDGGAGDGWKIDIDSAWNANCSVYYKG